jgi:hypothetical protein
MAKSTGAGTSIRQSGKKGGDAKQASAGGGRASASASTKMSMGGSGAGAGAGGGSVSQRGGSAVDQTAIGKIEVKG